MLATGNISPSQLPSGSVQVWQETQSTISCSPSTIVIVHSNLDPGRLLLEIVYASDPLFFQQVVSLPHSQAGKAAR